MVNGANTALAPIDILMGLFGRAPTGGPVASTGFAQLLGLFPQSVLPGQPSTEGDFYPISKPAVDCSSLLPVSGEVLLALPAVIADQLGLSQAPMPNQSGQPLGPTNENAVWAKASLLTGNNHSQPQLFLQLAPQGEKGMALPVNLPEGQEKEMMLPVSLRTVEREGDRLIADASLRTAAGKDIPIRLKLDLAGYLHRNENGETSLRGMTDQSAVDTVTRVRVPELLRSLNVQLIAIESVDTNQQAVINPILSRAAGPRLWPSSLPQNGSATAAVTDGQVQFSGMVKETAPIAFEESRFFDFTDPGDGRPAATKGTSPKNVDGRLAALSTTTTDPVLSSSSPKSAPESSSEARFYDLDQGIAQLRKSPGQKIRIQLVPAQLGRMELSVVSHRGLVTVHLAVESPQARQAVERNLGQLEAQLTASGIRIDQFQLHVQQSGRGESFGGQHQQSQGGAQGYQQSQEYRRRQWEQQVRKLGRSPASFQQVMINCLA